MCTVKARAWEKARRGRLASSPTTSCTREAAGKPEQDLNTHWCVFLNLPSGLGSSDERTVWATSDNQLSAEAAEELRPREAATCEPVQRQSTSSETAAIQPSPGQREDRSDRQLSGAPVHQLNIDERLAKHPSPGQRGEAGQMPPKQ